MASCFSPQHDLLFKMLIISVEKATLNPDYTVFLFCLFKHCKNLSEAECWERGIKERGGKWEREGAALAVGCFLPGSSDRVKLQHLHGCDTSITGDKSSDLWFQPPALTVLLLNFTELKISFLYVIHFIGQGWLQRKFRSAPHLCDFKNSTVTLG